MGRFVWVLVGNPEDQFCHIAAKKLGYMSTFDIISYNNIFNDAFVSALTHYENTPMQYTQVYKDFLFQCQK